MTQVRASKHEVAKKIRSGQHVPDILDCLAQLSNDEVPTPPKFARAVLDILPGEVWDKVDYVWLDPFCKSGIFLRETAGRLLEGLSDQIPDFQKRRDHIYRNMLWGTSITEMTGMISRRSLYYSRDATGPASVVNFEDEAGNLPFIRANHTFSKKKDGTVTGCTICGASPELERGEGRENYAYSFSHGDYPTEEMKDMKFDVIVGNPPYHLEDSGHGTSAAPIYQLFVDQAKRLNPRHLSMIIPSRWFAGGKGLDGFRESMLGDNSLRSIDDFLSASDAFPGIGLKGGVCYFLWDRDNPGPCRVTTRYNDWPVSTTTRPLLEKGSDVFIRFNEGVSILKKVVAVETGRQDDSLALPEGKRFDRLVSSRKPFGLETTFKGKKSGAKGDLLIHQNGGTGYVARDVITTGLDYIDNWKIYVGRAAPGTGNKDTYPHKIISTPFVGKPGSVSSETYLCIGPFDSQAKADNALSYLSCRLTRLLILMHKPSQDTTRKVYTFVPAQDWTKKWTDKDLYVRYGLNEDEITFIEKVVRPMDLADSSDD